MWAALIWMLDLFWRNAVSVVPLALLVLAICRWTPCRPATRHALWLGLLGWLVLGAALPPIGRSPAVSAVGPSPDRPGEAPSEPLDEVAPSVRRTPEQLAFERPQAAADQHRRTSVTRLEASPSDESCATDPSTPTPPRTAAPAPPSPPERLVDRLAWAGQPSPSGAPEAAEEDHCPRAAAHTPILDELDEPPLGSRVFEKRPSDQSRDREGAVPLPGVWTAPSRSRLCLDGRGSEGASQSLSGTDSAWTAISRYGSRWLTALVTVRDAVGRLPALPHGIWLSGILFFAAARTVQMARFKQRVRQGLPAPAGVLRLANQAASAVGLRCAPRIVMVRERVSPMIWCGRRPVLVLPRKLWKHLDRAGRRAVVFHELAHLRRKDHAICWIEWFVGAIYWWHPLVWWIRSRLREEAENCCDAWVTWLLPGGRRAYAEALLKTREFTTGSARMLPAAGIGAISGHAKRFARRLTMVMTERTTPNTSFAGIGLVLSIVVAGWLVTPARSAEPVAGPAANSAVIAAPTAPTALTTPTAPVALNAPQAPPLDSAPQLSSAPPRGSAPPFSSAPPRGSAPSKVSVPPMPTRPAIDGLRITGQLLAAGPETSPPVDEEALEARLAELEAQLARLSDQIEKLSVAGAPGPAKTREGAARVTPPSAQMPPSPGVPPRPLVPARPELPPYSAIGEALAAAADPLAVRTYKLPSGIREALTKLLIRDDVPIRVQPLGDGIEVHATEADHARFKAFVDVLTGKGDEVVGYRVSEGKLGDLLELMKREDVPIQVEPGKGEIRVHGGPAVQFVFKSFVDMIHPRQEKTKIGQSGGAPWAELLRRDGLGSGAGREAMRAYEEALRAHGIASDEATKVYEKAMREVLQTIEAQGGGRAGSRERQMAASQLRRQARELEQQAEQLQRQADLMQEKADRMRAEAEEALEKASDAKNERQSDHLQSRADELNRQAEELEQQRAVLESQASLLEDSAAQLVEQAEAALEGVKQLLEQVAPQADEPDNPADDEQDEGHEDDQDDEDDEDENEDSDEEVED